MLRPSRFISSDGLWSLDVVDGNGDERDECALEVRLNSDDGISLSGDMLVPPGPLFLSASVEADQRATRVAALTSGELEPAPVLRFTEGRITAKEAAGVGGLGGVAGLSELKVVGSFTAASAPPARQPAQPST